MPDFAKHVRACLGTLRVPPEREAEIVAELAEQMEQVYRDAMAEGATDSDALARAEACMGDWSRLAREIDSAERPAPPPAEYRAGVLSGIGQDVRYAFRFLRRNPTFTTIAVATLAFGIGGTTSIFTMVDALVLRDLPYRQPNQLMTIETRRTDQPEIEPWTSMPDFSDYQQRQHGFSAMAGISPVWNVVATNAGPTEQLNSLYVTPEFFPILGARAPLGRTFTPEEDHAVVLSHRYWQRRFSGRSDVIGQALRLDGASYTIVGVMPADFRWLGEPVHSAAVDIDLWLPMAANQLAHSIRSVRYLKVVARRRAGVTEAQARDEIRRISATLAVDYPAFDKGYLSDARPLRDQVTGKSRAGMLLLLGAVGFVLLMVCANVANLLLARAALRGREMAVRVAVGAGAWRLVRQLLVEGLLLASLGGLAAVPVAYFGLRALVAAGPAALLHGANLRLDLRAVGFTAAAILLCAVLAGLPPAWRVLQVRISDAGRGLVAGHHRVRSALVVAQIAASLVLLTGSALLVRSFRNVLAVPSGIDAHNLLTVSTQLPSSARTPQLRREMYQRIQDRLLAEPGVVNVAAVSRLPFSGKNLGTWVFVEGRDIPGAPGVEVEYRVTTPTYFETMGIRRLAGRIYDSRDEANPWAVVVVNRAMALKLWPGEEATGKRIKLSSTPQNAPWTTVIGVVDDIRHFGLEAEARPEVYRPYGVNPLGAPVLTIRTRFPGAAMLPSLAVTIRSVDPEIPTYNEFSMEELVDRSTRPRRFVMLLLTAFAAAAMLLAGIGIYGSVSQLVAQRTGEIGVRMALGATPAEVLRMVLREGGRLLALGALLGIALAGVMASTLRSMLFEVAPLDLASFAVALGILVVFALTACYVPAKRAARLDPLEALRAN